MSEPTFPLVVHADGRDVLPTALDVYRGDFGHDEQRVAIVVDDVLARIPADEPGQLDLDAAEMKVTWSALRSLLEDSRRDQGVERAHLHAPLARQPGEHASRAIALDTELRRRG